MPMPIEPTTPSADQDWDTLPNYVWKALTHCVRGPPSRPRRDSGDEEGDATTPARPVPRTIDVVRASEERRPLASGEKMTIEAADARRRDSEEGRADPVPNESIAMVPETTEAVEDDDFRVSKPNAESHDPKASTTIGRGRRRITIEFELSTDFSVSAATLLGRSGLRSDFDSEEEGDDSSDSDDAASGESSSCGGDDRYLDDLILAQ